MRKSIALAVAAAVALLPLAGAARPPSPQPAVAAPLAQTLPLPTSASIPPDQLAALVDGVVREAMVRDHIAGVEVSVVQDGQVLLDRGYGFSGPGGRPVDPDQTLFRIASVTKTFTWIAALKEVEAGRMQLDAPINRYLPAELAVPDVSGWRQVELRDLMTHTPGFEDRMFDHAFMDRPEDVRSLEAQLRLARPQRVFPPGTTPAYSNYGAKLAGAAVSHLEGQPYPTLIEREILQPLGMAHTTCREPYPARANLPAPMSPQLAADGSTGYHWTGDGFEPQPYVFVTGGAPAGAGSSTAGDMARYMLMILGNGQLGGATIYGPATAQALKTPLPVEASGAGPLDHGFMEYQLPGGFTGHGHDGDLLWFHSALVTIPELRLGIFVTTNTDTGPALRATLPARIVEHFYAPPPPPLTGSPALARQAEVYAGTYLTNWRAFGGLEKFASMMVGEAAISVTPDGRLLTPGPDGAQAWVLDGAPGHFRAVDGPQTMSFRLGGERAVRWYPPDGVMSYDRVGPLYQLGVLADVAALALAALIATLAGPAIRWRRAPPQTGLQRNANRIQLAAAALWALAFVAAAVFASSIGNQARLLADWPSPVLVAASAAALAAALASGFALLLTPFAWRSGADEGWGAWRKLRFSMTSVVFAALGFQLACWGALEPWGR
ncbi:MAG TPA: serine hydrolase domain-containing protein [Caulobacteraceae bacterium]|nr:serine hydrolase domain-containing protein [Caulobacteraceae bacterium]